MSREGRERGGRGSKGDIPPGRGGNNLTEENKLASATTDEGSTRTKVGSV